MALRFIDSCGDHYGTNQIKGKYFEFRPNGGSVTSGGQHGNRINHTGSLELHLLDVGDSAQAEWFTAFWWNGDMATNERLVGFMDSGTVHVEIMPTGGTFLGAYRNGTLLATAGSSTPDNGWVYLEIRVLIADSGGRVVVKQDGTTIIDFTGDTRNAGNASANQVIFGGRNAIGTGQNWDDFVLMDSTGSAPTNTFLGQLVQVDVLFPTGNGNSSQWVGSDSNSADNYALVDEATPDTADYVKATSTGDKDTYAFGNMGAAGTIFGVQINAWAAKTDGVARTLKSVARLADGTEADSTAQGLYPDGEYTYRWDVRAARPGGGVWSADDIDNAEFGIKVG
jgi:hypothetical protein